MADNQPINQNNANQVKAFDFDIPADLENKDQLERELENISNQKISDELTQAATSVDAGNYATDTKEISLDNNTNEQTQPLVTEIDSQLLDYPIPPQYTANLNDQPVPPLPPIDDDYIWHSDNSQVLDDMSFDEVAFAMGIDVNAPINQTPTPAPQATSQPTSETPSPTPPSLAATATKAKKEKQIQTIEGEVVQINNDANRSKIILSNNGVDNTYLLTASKNDDETFIALKDVSKGDTISLSAQLNKHNTDKNTYWANDSEVEVVAKAPQNTATTPQNKDEIGKNRVIGVVTNKIANGTYQNLSIKDEHGDTSSYVFNPAQNKSTLFNEHFKAVEVGDVIDLKSNLQKHKSKENTFWANQSSLTVDKSLHHGNVRIDANGNRIASNTMLDGSAIAPSIFMSSSGELMRDLTPKSKVNNSIDQAGMMDNAQKLKDMNMLEPVVVDGKEANVIKVDNNYVTMLKIGETQVPFHLEVGSGSGWQVGMGFDEKGVIPIPVPEFFSDTTDPNVSMYSNPTFTKYSVILDEALPSNSMDDFNATVVEFDKENMAELDKLVSSNAQYENGDDFKVSRVNEILSNLEAARLDNENKVINEPYIPPVLESDAFTGHLLEDIDTSVEDSHIFLEAEDKSRKLEIHSPLFGEMAKAGLLKKGDLVTLEAKSLKDGDYIADGIAVTNHSQKNAFMEIPAKKDTSDNDLKNASLATIPTDDKKPSVDDSDAVKASSVDKPEGKDAKTDAKPDPEKKQDDKDKPKYTGKKGDYTKKPSKDDDKSDDEKDEEYKKYNGFGSGYNPKGRNDSKKHTDDDGKTVINNFYNSPQDNGNRPNNAPQNGGGNGGGGGGGGGGSGSSYDATSDFVVGVAGIAGGLLGGSLKATGKGIKKGSAAIKKMNAERKANKAAQAYGSRNTGASSGNAASPNMGVSSPASNASASKNSTSPPAGLGAKKPSGLGFNVPTNAGHSRQGTSVDILAQRINDGAARGETLNGAILGSSLSQTHDYFNSFKDNYDTINKLSSSTDPKDKAEVARRKGLLQDDFDKYSKMSQSVAKHTTDPKKATQETSGLVQDSLKDMNSKMESMVDDSIKKKLMDEKDGNGILNKQKMQKINEALSKAIAKAAQVFAAAMSKVFSKPSAGKAP